MLSVFHGVVLGLAALGAGAIDTIVGGGGLLTLPALLAVGLTPALALGTNQFTLSFGALVGTWRYARQGSLRWWPETVLCAAGVLPGAWIGSRTAMAVPATVLHVIVLILLVGVGGLMMVYRQDPAEAEHPRPVTWGRGRAPEPSGDVGRPDAAGGNRDAPGTAVPHDPVGGVRWIP